VDGRPLLFSARDRGRHALTLQEAMLFWPDRSGFGLFSVRIPIFVDPKRLWYVPRMRASCQQSFFSPVLHMLTYGSTRAIRSHGVADINFSLRPDSEPFLRAHLCRPLDFNELPIARIGTFSRTFPPAHPFPQSLLVHPQWFIPASPMPLRSPHRPRFVSVDAKCSRLTRPRVDCRRL